MLDGRRIGLVLLSAIGDVVHALPLAASIRAAAPRARLEWVVQPVPAEIVSAHPGVDRTWVLDRRRGWRGFREFRQRVRDQDFDLVLVLQVYAKASLATLFLQSPRKIGFDRARARELSWLATNERIPARPLRHVCEQYLEFADHLGMTRRYEWALPLTDRERADQERFYDGFDRPLAALVPGTSRPVKEWPPERWAGLADGLHGLGYAPCILGGGGTRERALAGRIVEVARAPVRDLLRPDLRRLLWILDGAALAVSCDTGPYHVAIALGVPAIGLYGVTDPARVGPNRRCLDLLVDAFHEPGEPWHPLSEAIRPGRMERIGVGRVMETVAFARARYPRAVDGPARAPAPESA
ncbi:MAG: glycosyltransferase family 9 protein [Gemmatimonadota bacterium]